MIKTPDHNCNQDTPLRVIAGLIRHGLTLTEIGQRLGLSNSSAEQIAHAHGLARPVGADEPSLSQRQVRILVFLQDYTARHPYPPTVREITRTRHISSTSVTDYNLRRLEQMEYLTRKPSIARSILLTVRGRMQLPVLPDSPAREEAAREEAA